MAFVVRTFENILSDMIDYVKSNTEITDFNPGSVTRTLLEAAALEDDEQYFQMVQLLDMFSIASASGPRLDRRLADFGIVRQSAQPSVVRVKFFDTTTTTNNIAVDASAGTSSVSLFDTSSFPTAGYPYVVRIGEGTPRVQDISVTNNDTSTNILTLGTPLVRDAEVEDRVGLITGAVNRSIPVGTVIEAPAVRSQSAKRYTTTEPALIIAGSRFSNEVIARADAPGTRYNVGAERITRFGGSAPFQGAGVLNLSGASGGTNTESDRALKIRAFAQIQSLSRGTPLAIQTAALGVSDPVTGETVSSASIIEDFTEDEVNVYIDNGTGLIADEIVLPQDSLAAQALSGASALTLVDASNFPSAGKLLVESNNIGNAEYVTYAARVGNVLTLDAPLSATHPINSIVLFVDELAEAAESGQRRFRFTNSPVIRNTDRVFADSGGGWTELTRDSDFILNRGTGELQIVDVGGLFVGTQVVASYGYYDGLIAETQKVLEGDLSSSALFPGVKAAGIFLNVEPPVLRRISVRASISAERGFSEDNLVTAVRRNIENYIISLGVGENVIRSRMIDVAHDVEGVRDVSISVPTGNITVLENELPVPFDVNGNTLVVVS